MGKVPNDFFIRIFRLEELIKEAKFYGSPIISKYLLGGGG